MQSRAKRWTKYASIYTAIALSLTVLVYFARKASGPSSRPATTSYTPQSLSNGTSVFAPTTVLISLDGFRADFLHRDLTPTLNGFIRSGVSPKYMTPSFPSVTFPNHFTLVTGLYPESHGLVGNTFWDPHTQKEFYYTDPERSMKPEWWNAEPLWETAGLAGLPTAIHMWPGSEAHIGTIEPQYVDHYSSSEILESKVDRILGWLDQPGPQDYGFDEKTPRPQLIAAYVPNVDADGHKYGPNSTEIRGTIAMVDTMLAQLFDGIEARNLTDIVNIVVVSDHGMATTDTSRLIQLEELIDTSLIEHTDGWPLYGLRPYDTSEAHLMELYNQLWAKSQTPEHKGSFEVYLRDKNMPERYHFSKNPRIAPLWIVPTTGWAIVTKSEFNVQIASQENQVYHPRGIHGYDHENPLMRAIFVARGPAFPHPPGSQVSVFQNIEVYNIVCDSLGINPVQNNGTLRLPLTTLGVHEGTGPDEIPEDPMPSGATVPAIMPVPRPSSMPPVLSAHSSPTGTAKQEVVWTTDATGSLVTVAAGVEDDEHFEEGEHQDHDTKDHDNPGGSERPGSSDDYSDENLNHTHWWDWVTGKLEQAKAWAAGLFSSSEKPPNSGHGGAHNAASAT